MGVLVIARAKYRATNQGVTETEVTEMAPEAITGAAGDQAEGGGGADQSGGDLIHGAVATDRDDQIAAIVKGAAG
jgi:hypothetical protein